MPRTLARLVQPPRTLLLLFLLCGFVQFLPAATRDDPATRIASLIDPAKLATLTRRGAIPRVQKITYHLEIARRKNVEAGAIIDQALRQAGITNSHMASLTRDTLLRNLTIAERLGCLTPEGLDEMRQGKSPTITTGPYIGDQLSVDHIVPLDVAPELDHVLANLELMPKRMNSSKRNKVGVRQIDFARKFHDAGLLSARGYRAVLAAAAKPSRSR